MTRHAAAGTLVLTAFMSHLAAADPARPGVPPTVVVLTSDRTDPVTLEASARVQGELSAAGFRVAVVPVGSAGARAEIETAGSDLGPVGAFFISVDAGARSGPVAEIWVSDRLRQTTVVERARLTESDRQRESEILAVRAVELLKASLAESWFHAPPPPVTPEARPTVAADAVQPHVAAVAPRAARRPFAAGLGLGVGAGMLESFRPPSPVWMPAFFASFGWRAGVALELEFLGLGPPVTIQGSAGSARVEQRLGTIGLVATLWPEWPVVPFAAAAVGAQEIHASGTGVAPYRGVDVDAWSFFTSAGLGAAAPLYAGLSIVAGARAALAWPPTAVLVGGTDAGHFGAPSILAETHVLGVFP
jgi:hypothetical protein